MSGTSSTSYESADSLERTEFNENIRIEKKDVKSVTGEQEDGWTNRKDEGKEVDTSAWDEEFMIPHLGAEMFYRNAKKEKLAETAVKPDEDEEDFDDTSAWDEEFMIPHLGAEMIYKNAKKEKLVETTIKPDEDEEDFEDTSAWDEEFMIPHLGAKMFYRNAKKEKLVETTIKPDDAGNPRSASDAPVFEDGTKETDDAKETVDEPTQNASLDVNQEQPQPDDPQDPFQWTSNITEESQKEDEEAKRSDDEDIPLDHSETWDFSLQGIYPDYKSKVVWLDGGFYEKYMEKCRQEKLDKIKVCESNEKKETASASQACPIVPCLDTCFKSASIQNKENLTKNGDAGRRKFPWKKMTDDTKLSQDKTERQLKDDEIKEKTPVKSSSMNDSSPRRLPPDNAECASNDSKPCSSPNQNVAASFSPPTMLPRALLLASARNKKSAGKLSPSSVLMASVQSENEETLNLQSQEHLKNDEVDSSAST